MSGTDYVLTPNLGLYKPLPTADINAWGGHLNSNADMLDTALHSVQTAGPFLALAGGTVTGLTTHSGTTSPQLQISGTTTAGLTLTAPTGNSRQMRFQTAGSDRWVWQINSTAEGGSNAGSDYDLRAYSDTGSYLFSPLGITRSTGVVTAYGLSVTANQPLTFHQAIQGVTINGATLSPAATGGFQQNLSASGSGTIGSITGMNQWNVNSDNMATPGQFVFHTAINYNFGGAAFVGNRGGLFCNMLQTGPVSGSSGAGGIEGFQFSVTSTNTFGGTNSGLGAAGAIFGGNIYTRVGAGSVNLQGHCGLEIDFDAALGTTYQSYSGMQVVATSLHKQTAVVQTLGYALGGQANSIGFDVGYAISMFSLTATGTVIRSDYNAAAPNFPIGRGIDFRPNTFSSDIFAAANCAITSTGAVRVGTGYHDFNAAGAIIDAAGTVATAGTLTAAVATTYPSDGNSYWCDDPYGGIWQVTFANGTSSITAITLTLAPVVRGAAPANPITLTPRGRLKIFFPGTITANLTWDSTRNGLSLNPTGQHIGFNGTAPIAKPTVTGAWAGNTAGKALSTALAAFGLIVDSTTA